MNRRNSWFAAGAVIGVLALGSVLGLFLEPARAGETREAVLAVEGMNCASCAFAVKAALQKLDGVAEAKVSYREKRATVVFDPDRVTPEDLVAAVEKAGFRATLGPPERP